MTIAQETYWVIIPAAGTGARFRMGQTGKADGATQLPKQYQQLRHQKTVAEYTLEQLSQHPQIAGLILALHPEDKYFATLDVLTSGITRGKGIHCITGGTTRTLSVLQALCFAWTKKYVQAQDWILIHDIARPLVSQNEISQLIQAIDQYHKTYQGLSLGLPVYDSVKRISFPEMRDGINKAGNIKEVRLNTEIVEEKAYPILQSEAREQIWRSITPQAAQADILVRALEQHQNNSVITDEMSALALIQAPCALIPGNSQNIKITTVEDLKLARCYLSFV